MPTIISTTDLSSDFGITLTNVNLSVLIPKNIQKVTIMAIFYHGMTRIFTVKRSVLPENFTLIKHCRNFNNNNENSQSLVALV